MSNTAPKHLLGLLGLSVPLVGALFLANTTFCNCPYGDCTGCSQINAPRITPYTTPVPQKTHEYTPLQIKTPELRPTKIRPNLEVMFQNTPEPLPVKATNIPIIITPIVIVLETLQPYPTPTRYTRPTSSLNVVVPTIVVIEPQEYIPPPTNTPLPTATPRNTATPFSPTPYNVCTEQTTVIGNDDDYIFTHPNSGHFDYYVSPSSLSWSVSPYSQTNTTLQSHFTLQGYIGQYLRITARDQSVPHTTYYCDFVIQAGLPINTPLPIFN